MIRNTPVEEGNTYYEWNIPSVYQCVWFVYFRCAEEHLPFPCYWDRTTKTGSYTNAKEWLQNYREPWQVKGLDYTPVAHDIVVYDGQYGHVQFMETDTMYSEYSNGNKDSFRNGLLSQYKGQILGYLHCPLEPLNTVERNENVDQIQTTDTTLRVRMKPSLDADIVGHVSLGYYNVLQIKADESYTWYQIGKNRWCADVSVVYLPAEDDIVKRFEEFVNAFKVRDKENQKKIADYEKKLKDIHKLSEVNDG